MGNKSSGEMKKMHKDSRPGAAVLVAIFLAFVLVAMTPVAVRGYEAYTDIIAAPEAEVIYQDLAAKESPGALWSKEFVSHRIEGVEEWNVNSNQRPVNPISPDICSLGDIPKTALLTSSVNGSGFEVYAQIHGAGQGRAAYESYKREADNCVDFEEVESWEDSGINFIKFDSSMIASAGDAIVGFTAPDKKIFDERHGEILSRVRDTLTESKCVSIPASSEDTARSFFYDRNAYRGLYGETPVSAQIDTNGFSKPVLPELNVLNYPYAKAPESPLPENFSKELPEEVNKPAPSEEPERGEFSGVASYLVPDDQGPGCGWDWTGQRAPVYDREAMETDKQNSINDLQTDLNNKAVEYVNIRRAWTVDSMDYLGEANEWNRFVKNHNDVTTQWIWLEEQREDFKPVWDDWVRDYKDWESFPERQKLAKTDWERDLQTCRDQRDAYDDWDSRYGDQWRNRYNPDPIPTPTSPSDPEVDENDAPAVGSTIGGVGVIGGAGIFVMSPAPPSPPEEDATESPTPTPSERPTPTPTESPSATPTPTQPTPRPTAPAPPRPSIPAPPVNCPTDPQEPSILSQDRGEAPEAPLPPEGVTVPDSWEDPRE